MWRKSKKVNILITGCSGFIGYHLSLELLRNNHHIYGVDNIDPYYCISLKKKRLEQLLQFKRFSYFNNDINGFNLQKCKEIDFVVHLAAQPGVRLNHTEYQKYIDSNISSTISLANEMVENNVKNLIFASSSSVYDGSSKAKMTEEYTSLKPSSFYGISKLFMEKIIEKYTEKSYFNAVGLRFFTVYGSYGRPDMAYYKFTKQILNNEKIKLHNSGEMSRDMTHISDVVNGIKLLLGNEAFNNQKLYEIFNIGSSKTVKLTEMIYTIESHLGLKANYEHISTFNESIHTNADISKAKKCFGYEPRVKFSDGYVEFYNWFKEYSKK